MSWQISLLENTVQVDTECEKELQAYYEQNICDDDCVYRGKLNFNEEHSEHMDFVSHEGIREILSRHKVSGRVCFGSLQGDNANSFWGYEFKNGDLTHLSGKVVWLESDK